MTDTTPTTTTTTSSLYIQIENGATVKHPMSYENLIQCYGNIPDNFAPFTRITLGDSGIVLSQYQKPVNTYVLGLDGVTWQDSWTAEDMTDDERAQLHQKYKDRFAANNHPHLASWVFDEDTFKHVPPVARPSDPPPDGTRYIWQESSQSWLVSPPIPTDGQKYRWDFPSWNWVAIDPV